MSVACSDLDDLDADDLLDDGLTSGFADPPLPGVDPAERDDEPGDDAGDAGDAGDESGDGYDPAALGDDFDGDELSGWGLFNDALATRSVEGGHLMLDAGANTAWVHGQTAILLSKEVAGDFMATASLRVVGLAAPDEPPPPIFRFGGLLARSAQDGPENTVHIALGTDDDPSVETKSTRDGVSTWQGPPWPSAAGEVRICRLGSSFLMYVREADGAWVLSNAYARPDMPEVLEVGPMAFNNSPTPDLHVSFDFVHFAAVSSQADCEQ
ncbi:MAG: hypothetical protein IAG13_16665 [Deltaproteobacteria bacterium]|nr:hypothetical protein [Nannocystaceae bacterium]